MRTYRRNNSRVCSGDPWRPPQRRRDRWGKSTIIVCGASRGAGGRWRACGSGRVAEDKLLRACLLGSGRCRAVQGDVAGGGLAPKAMKRGGARVLVGSASIEMCQECRGAVAAAAAATVARKQRSQAGPTGVHGPFTIASTVPGMSSWRHMASCLDCSPALQHAAPTSHRDGGGIYRFTVLEGGWVVGHGPVIRYTGIHPQDEPPLLTRRRLGLHHAP